MESFLSPECLLLYTVLSVLLAVRLFPDLFPYASEEQGVKEDLKELRRQDYMRKLKDECRTLRQVLNKD